MKTDREKTWHSNYKKLKKFIIKNKKFPSHRAEDLEERKLGIWKHIQNRRYHKVENRKELSREEIELLEKIPNWSWSLDEKWMIHYNEVKEFIIKNNRYPSQHKNKLEKKLYKWIDRQMRKKDSLSKENIKLLEKIPNWKWGNEDRWMKNFEKFKKYYLKHKRFPQYHSKDFETRCIGLWFKKQRTKYFYDKKLTPEKVKMFESLPNFSWWNNTNTIWTKQYKELSQFVKENNKIPIFSTKNKHEFKIAHWLYYQKKKYDKLSKEKKELLKPYL